MLSIQVRIVSNLIQLKASEGESLLVRVVTGSYQIGLLNGLDNLHLWLAVAKKFEGFGVLSFPDFVVMGWFG